MRLITLTLAKTLVTTAVLLALPVARPAQQQRLSIQPVISSASGAASGAAANDPQATRESSKESELVLVLLHKSRLSETHADSAKLEEFEKKFKEENRISLILDLADLARKEAVLWWTPEIDVTQGYIDAYKGYESTNAAPSLKTAIPKASIGMLDVQILHDKKKGIKQLARVFDQAVKKLTDSGSSPAVKEEVDKYVREQSREVRDSMFKELDAFARERGFTIIFNSAAKLYGNTASLPSTDITQPFIDRFNRLHP